MAKIKRLKTTFGKKSGVTKSLQTAFERSGSGAKKAKKAKKKK